jgi:SAM-dependent methyltransferase
MSHKINNKFIQLDEEGYFVTQGIRYEDRDSGAYMLRHLRYDNRILYTQAPAIDEDIVVEAFSDPFVVRHVKLHKTKPSCLILQLPYEYEFEFQLNPDEPAQNLFIDQWDRFRGVINKIPFVFSRNAQNDFFNLLEEFDDESFQIGGETYETLPWQTPTDNVDDAKFWSQLYDNWQSPETKPGWDIGEPAAALRDVTAQIKLNRCRVAVLGCGSGHDAAYLAGQGHIVTAFDFSAEAIERARKNYGHLTNLQFVQADAFKLIETHAKQFDVVFEHTFFCAINPDKRKQAVQVYKRLLAEGGYLLGVFFILNPSPTPPFGLTEWELREYLKSHFSTLYWTRWKKSIPSRMGRELIVYAQLKE